MSDDIQAAGKAYAETLEIVGRVMAVNGDRAARIVKRLALAGYSICAEKEVCEVEQLRETNEAQERTLEVLRDELAIGRVVWMQRVERLDFLVEENDRLRKGIRLVAKEYPPAGLLLGRSDNENEVGS